jgi:hypothetical protein
MEGSMRRGRLEIVTVGFNPNLQLVASDPAGGGYDLGIFIGPNDEATAPNLRQLFLLCVKSFNAGQRGRLVGFRQYLTLYVPELSSSGLANYPLERPVETPTWKYVDGNVLWGIRRVSSQTHFQPNANNAQNLAFEYSQTPSQLFETIAGPLITPPYGGTFPGNALTPELSRFFDMRCRRWSEPVEVDVPFEGPCDIAFFASVQQTNPSTRTPPPLIACSNPILVSMQFNGNDGLPQNGSGAPFYYVVTTSGASAVIGDLLYDNGSGTGTVTVVPMAVGQTIIPSQTFTGGTITLNQGVIYTWSGSSFPIAVSQSQFLTTQGATPEDAFVQNYPGSYYGRIAGALIFEMEEQAPTGAPKTYRRPGDADRITRDTTETGDNVMRRSAEDTSEYKAAKGDGPPKRPASPPHVSGALGKLPGQDVIKRLADRWRKTGAPGREPGQVNHHRPPTLPTGVGSTPKDEDLIAKIVKKWRRGE